MNKAKIKLKKIERINGLIIKVTVDVKNIGDYIWNAGEYNVRALLMDKFGNLKPMSGVAGIHIQVNPGQEIEKEITFSGIDLKDTFKDNSIHIDVVWENHYWLNDFESFKIDDIQYGTKSLEYTTSEIISGEEENIELGMPHELIDLKQLRVEPIGEFNPCYGDDFQNLNNWTQFNGSYELENDSAKLVTSQAWIDLINNDLGDITNTTIEVSGKMLNNTSGGYFGILFGYIDASNYWRISVRSNNGNYLCIYHYVNGVNQSADYYYVGYIVTPNRWTSLKLNLTGNTVKAYIDNSLMFEYTNNGIVPGKIGLTAYKLGTQQVWFDDFLVSQGVYSVHLYNKFTELPLVSKVNKSTSMDMILGQALGISDNKLRLKILNNGANNQFKIKVVYKPIKIIGE